MSTVKYDNPDKPPEKQDEEEVQPVQEFKYYLKHEVSYKIIEQKWVMFCLLAAVGYLFHLSWAIAGVNMYTDYTRMIPCGTA